MADEKTLLERVEQAAGDLGSIAMNLMQDLRQLCTPQAEDDRARGAALRAATEDCLPDCQCYCCCALRLIAKQQAEPWQVPEDGVDCIAYLSGVTCLGVAWLGEQADRIALANLQALCVEKHAREEADDAD